MVNNLHIKRYRLLFAFTCLVIANVCCTNHNVDKVETIDKGNGLYEKKSFDSARQVSIDWEYTKDSGGNFIANGFYKEFYGNGGLKLQGFFKNDKKDGTCIFYSEKGKIIAKQNYFEGIAKGKQYLFYDNGNIKRIKFDENDTLSYFSIDYSPNGEIKFTHGMPIVARRAIYKNVYSPQDTLIIINFVAVIEKMKTLLTIKIYDENGKCYYSNMNVDFLTANYLGSPVDYFEKQFKRGKHKYVATVELRDSATDKVLIIDSNVIDIIVK